MKVSIVTVTYNSEATVRDTLESVLAQTYGDIEHIVVDGASDDHTLDIVQELEPVYGGRLRWVSERDGGIYDAMNKGIDMATGDVVGFLNSDDYFTSPDVVAKMSEGFAGDLDAVYGDVHYVDPKNLTRCTRYYSSRKFSRRRMLLGYMPAHPSFYCRKSVYNRFGAFDTDFKVAADFEQLLRAIYVNRISTRYIPMDFVTMRRGGASTAGLQSHLRIMLDHFKAYRKNGIRAAICLDPLRYIMKVWEVFFQNRLR